MPYFSKSETLSKARSPMNHKPSDHLCQLTQHWNELQHHIKTDNVLIDGQTLTIAAVVAVANHNTSSTLTDDTAILNRVEASYRVLMDAIDNGKTVYGVNTGFGGSAELRTSNSEQLQAALMQLLHVGILTREDKGLDQDQNQEQDLQQPTSRMSDMQLPAMRKHSLPDQIVRAMMLVRCGTLMRGHSGVTMDVIRGIHKLLAGNATPIVPLRGSISASGDLMPLSYVAGVLTGNPDIYVRIKGNGPTAVHSSNDKSGSVIVTADVALQRLGMEPLTLKAKCGLAIANGTGASAAAASLALFQSHQLAVWSQLLTVMMSEAIIGSEDNFALFIAKTRPHPGQLEVARNLTTFLGRSALTAKKVKPERTLAQDRYTLRTAPQWIGPILEHLQLAQQQVEIELNSTTDNPLIDIDTNAIYSGGNFQATSVTSAMELASSAAQMLGRIVYAQCSEILNHDMNPDLPPNLSADDPSMSLPMKGLDIAMSAYMAELAQLTHPVSSHIQSAEMHNQAVNSMALVASRIALEANDVLYLMVSSYIFVLCQALDLRCLQIEHRLASGPLIEKLVKCHFSDCISASSRLSEVASQIWQAVEAEWIALADKDLDVRCDLAVADATGAILDILDGSQETSTSPIMVTSMKALKRFRDEAASILRREYEAVRNRFFVAPPTTKYLGATSRIIYQFVRHELGIPMHRGLVDHPTAHDVGPNGKTNKKTIGSHTSEVYAAVRNGSLFGRIMAWIHNNGAEKEEINGHEIDDDDDKESEDEDDVVVVVKSHTLNHCQMNGINGHGR